MSDPNRFLWLEGVFDEDTMFAFPSISPASNAWQKGFLDGLHQLGHEVEIIGFPYERIWPFGRLSVGCRQAALANGLSGKVVGYKNIPFLRDIFRYMNMLSAAKNYFRNSKKKPDFQIVYSCSDNSIIARWIGWTSLSSPSIRLANYIREHYGVPWICIHADGTAPPGADGYVYLPWSNYQSAPAAQSSIHIDGGVPEVEPRNSKASVANNVLAEKILMYMGALTPHGGVTQLARAFSKINDEEIQLWICGRGENPELERMGELDQRIKLHGFVEENELNRLANKAFAFANPRPNSFAPNKLNYPSKLLLYLAYGKPVISTFTDGLSPEYDELLIPIKDETDECLGKAIKQVLNMEEGKYKEMRNRIAKFNETHTWVYQCRRFTSWLDQNM